MKIKEGNKSKAAIVWSLFEYASGTHEMKAILGIWVFEHTAVTC